MKLHIPTYWQNVPVFKNQEHCLDCPWGQGIHLLANQLWIVIDHIRHSCIVNVFLNHFEMHLRLPKYFDNPWWWNTYFMLLNFSTQQPPRSLIFFFFNNWDSLHARLNSHYKAYKKKYKKIKAYRKSVYKEPTDKRCLLLQQTLSINCNSENISHVILHKTDSITEINL